MDIIQIVGLGLVATLLVLVLREQRPEMAMMVSLVAGAIILLLVVVTYLQTLLRIVGLAYLAEFGAQVCRDAGEGNIAARIEFAAKVIILVLAVPIIVAVMESILSLIP